MVQYKLGDFKWLDLVAGKITFEIAEGRIRRWEEVVIPQIGVKTEEIEFRGEIYELDETGTASVYSQTKDGGEKTKVPYSVLFADSGKQIAVEEWHEEVRLLFKQSCPGKLCQNLRFQ